jgi:hypothetical protein
MVSKLGPGGIPNKYKKTNHNLRYTKTQNHMCCLEFQNLVFLEFTIFAYVFGAFMEGQLIITYQIVRRLSDLGGHAVSQLCLAAGDTAGCAEH